MEYRLVAPRGFLVGDRLTLSEPYSEENEKEAEIRFPRGMTKLSIEGKPFTHTTIGVPIEVVQGGEKKRLTVELLEGAGDFTLHLYFGKPTEGDQLILALKALRRADRVVIGFRWS